MGQHRGGGVGMPGAHVPKGSLAGAHQFDPLADGLAAVGQHSQSPPGEDRVGPQGVVLEGHAPAVAQKSPGGGAHIGLGPRVPEGGALQELRYSDYPVAVVSEQLQLLAEAVGDGGAAGHVEPVLLKDDLAPEEVRVLQEDPLHGLPGGLHLRLVGGEGQPPRPVEAGGHVLVVHEGVGVVAGEAPFDAVHVVGGPGEADGVAPALLHGPVEPLEVLDHHVQAGEVLAPAIDQGLPAEEDVGVGVAGDLVTPGQKPRHQLRAVDHAPLVVLAEVGVVVVGDAAPGGGAVLARLVRVVVGGVPHHVEGALGPVALQRLRQHQG